MDVMGYEKHTPAGIAQEALDVVKHMYHKKHNKTLDDQAALWLCGFVIDGTASLSKTQHTYRYQKQPSKVGSGVVWKGFVRNRVDTSNPVVAGKINYSSRPHQLWRLYSQVEVVTGDLLPEDALSILEIGEAGAYKEDKEIKEYERYKNRKIVDIDMDDYEE